MSIRKIGIIANIEKENAAEFSLHLKKWILSKGLEVFFERSLAEKLGEPDGQEREEIASKVDMVVVFGGDGTLLMAARSLRKYKTPILGINLGGFGFLTAVNLNEMLDALEIILRGDCTVEKRMMLDVAVFHNGKQTEEHSVLNDAVINRGTLCRIVELEALVDDQYLNTFKADGLIISTPTGSTAYSLSAGGPIIVPRLKSIIINPICPHTLTNRPVILPPDSVIKIATWSREGNATLTLDGQISVSLHPGDIIEIRKSKYVTNLIVSPHRDYLEILRSKLGWGGLPTGFKG